MLTWKNPRKPGNISIHEHFIKDKATPTSLHKKGHDKDPLICNYVLNSETNASNGVISVEHRRRRHRHRQRHDGIRNNGKILNSGESGNQKNDKTKSYMSILAPGNCCGRILFQLLPKSTCVLIFLLQSCAFHVLPGFTSVEILRQIQNNLRK